VLTNYLSLTQRLLQNPAAPTTLYSTSDLTLYINTARGQLAGESESIRYEGTLTTTIGQRAYNFSAINVGTPSSSGIQGAIHVRRIAYAVAAGRKWVAPRAFPWFDLFYLSNPVPQNGPPTDWAQYQQGGAGLGSITGEGTGSDASGSFYLEPPPDQPYTLYLDCVCYPIALAADTDPEAIPYLWTDAVPFWAAWYALNTSQTNARMADAEKYMQIYKQFVQNGRQFSNPSVDRYIYEQAFDPAQANKVAPPKTAGGQQ
jgi:hypothetical protein